MFGIFFRPRWNPHNANPPYPKENHKFLSHTGGGMAKEIPPIYAIIDEGGWRDEEDREYVEKGIREGWLTVGGYHFEWRGNDRVKVIRLLLK